MTIIVGVVLYHLHSLGLTSVGLLAICLNMVFAVLERLMQRHLMAQACLASKLCTGLRSLALALCTHLLHALASPRAQLRTWYRIAGGDVYLQAPVDISKPGMMLLNNACGLVPCGLLMVLYAEPARWSAVVSEMTMSGACFVLISCVNGLAISYAVRTSTPAHTRDRAAYARTRVRLTDCGWPFRGCACSSS